MTPAHLRRARISVFGTFFVVGFVMATWLVNIPAIQARTDVSHATLGLLLLVLGLGGVVSMQVAGLVITRLGSRTVTIIAVALDVAAINLPGWTVGPVGLAVALFVFGLGNGAADVAMNDQAVIVERRYGRPIMSAFHALWSIGGAVGALLGAGGQALGLDLRWSVGIASAVAAVLAVVAVSGLLPDRPAAAVAADRTETRATARPDPSAQPKVAHKIIAFGALAFLLMLSEGVANDWGPLQAVEHLGQPEAAASLAYFVFAVTMTVGRLTVDRVAHRFGPAFVVRYGSLTAAIGVGIVVVSGAYPLTLLGWAVYGLGLAGVVPQLFTAAGNLGGTAQSVVLSRVVGAGYVGMLAGPAVIGVLAGWVGLTYTFVLPLVLCLVGVVLASLVTATPAADREQEPATLR